MNKSTFQVFQINYQVFEFCLNLSVLYNGIVNVEGIRDTSKNGTQRKKGFEHEFIFNIVLVT